MFKIGVEAFGSARAGHARPLRGGDGEMRDGGRFRWGVGTPPYARILSGAVGWPALWPPPKACGGGKLPGRDESFPYELTATGIWRRVAGRACPAPTRGVDGKMENGTKPGGGACIILVQAL